MGQSGSTLTFSRPLPWFSPLRSWGTGSTKMRWGRYPGRPRGNSGESVRSCLVHWAVSNLITTSACLKPGRRSLQLSCIMGQPSLTPAPCDSALTLGLPLFLAPSLVSFFPVPSSPCQTSLTLPFLPQAPALHSDLLRCPVATQTLFTAF